MKLLGSILMASVVLIGGCSVSTEVASQLNGTWAREQNVVGSHLDMTLVVNDTVISGAGNYAIEAGRSGTLTVAGFYSAGTIKLTITPDYASGFDTRFEGTFTSSKRIAGKLISTNESTGQQATTPISFKRE